MARCSLWSRSTASGPSSGPCRRAATREANLSSSSSRISLAGGSGRRDPGLGPSARGQLPALLGSPGAGGVNPPPPPVMQHRGPAPPLSPGPTRPRQPQARHLRQALGPPRGSPAALPRCLSTSPGAPALPVPRLLEEALGRRREHAGRSAAPPPPRCAAKAAPQRRAVRPG